MVPAPTTPAVAMSRVGVSGGRSGIFATSRSAKKAWRCARDLGRGHELDEDVALELHALGEGPRDGGLQGLDRLEGRYEAALLARDAAREFLEDPFLDRGNGEGARRARRPVLGGEALRV
jgi:hypothetical protein